MQTVTSEITWRHRLDHFLARWAWNRAGHRVAPGLYALGNVGRDSAVLVTANYTLSFDALRQALAGISGYILVLDTRGINVWCAAGEGTFGTDELVRRVEEVRLKDVVDGRRLILPQLGAAGVSAHAVRQRSGFQVEYGPVRAEDLPVYLRAGQATPDMRTVRFGFAERLVLVPVELVHAVLPTLLVSVLLWLLIGRLAALATLAAVLGGTVLFPLLLPLLPTPDFSSKGFILGAGVSLPFVYRALSDDTAPLPVRWLNAAGFALTMSAVTAYLALNFTGSTPYASRSGTKREIYGYIRSMAWALTLGAGSVVLALVLRRSGR